MSEEIWKPIPNWINYEISNLGRVKRVACISSGRKLKERYINIIRSKRNNGKYIYLEVNLGTLHNHKNFSVARLILISFIGPPEDGEECRHLDDNPENCQLTNLAWGTRIQNRQDALINNKLAIGENNGMAKLTVNNVKIIKQIYKPYSKDFGSGALARKFNVNPLTILDIVNGRTWKNV